VNLRHPTSNPLYWSSSAVVDGRLVVKFAWSEVRATSLWREGLILRRLGRYCPSLPVPQPVVLHRMPALLATELVEGAPLRWEWARSLAGAGTTGVARQLGDFLGHLHDIDAGKVLAGLPVVEPAPQADTEALRRRFTRLVDDHRAASVRQWCGWVDSVLSAPSQMPDVLLHGDLHGHNQVWDQPSSTLLAVLDFEECGVGDPHFDLRYLPGYAPHLDLTAAVIEAYEQCSGRRLGIERVLAWHVLTALGDALWRTEAGIALPGGGTAATYVDELSSRLASIGVESRSRDTSDSRRRR
jgi:aminoglycoside phosphotransferase (APT) family kinase protein